MKWQNIVGKSIALIFGFITIYAILSGLTNNMDAGLAQLTSIACGIIAVVGWFFAYTGGNNI
jgi:hypothetical protein